MLDNFVNTPPSTQRYSNVTLNHERIKWVDVAKALGLFLVFWGHMLYGGSSEAKIINRAIYSFHMPMYFILAGYVLKPDYLTFKAFVAKKYKRILLPALLLYLITLPVYFLSHTFDVSTAKTICFKLFYITGMCAYNSPIWFFICLFQIFVVVKILDFSNASNKRIVITALISVILSFMMYESGWKYFRLFGLNKCCLGLFFFSFGVWLKKSKYKDYMNTIGVISLPIWFISGILVNSKVSMYGMGLGNFWLFMISGITGSLALFTLSHLLKYNDKLAQYAQWTIFIVGSHLLLVTLFSLLSRQLLFRGTHIYDIVSCIYVIIALWLYRFVCRFVEKYVPVLMGK